MPALPDAIRGFRTQIMKVRKHGAKKWEEIESHWCCADEVEEREGMVQKEKTERFARESGNGTGTGSGGGSRVEARSRSCSGGGGGGDSCGASETWSYAH